MLKIYYKIWVSLFIKIRDNQNDSKNEKAIIALSLIVITATNIINYFFIIYVFMLFFKIDLNIIGLIDFGNKYLTNIIRLFIFFIPNYLVLVYNNKHEKLVSKYEKENNTRLGLYYFIISLTLVVVFLILIVMFPHFFGLKPSSKG